MNPTDIFLIMGLWETAEFKCYDVGDFAYLSFVKRQYQLDRRFLMSLYQLTMKN